MEYVFAILHHEELAKIPKSDPEKRLVEIIRLLFNYVYEKDEDKDRYSFLFVDMSLKKTSKYRYFKCFNELDITPKE